MSIKQFFAAKPLDQEARAQHFEQTGIRLEQLSAPTADQLADAAAHRAAKDAERRSDKEERRKATAAEIDLTADAQPESPESDSPAFTFC